MMGAASLRPRHAAGTWYDARRAYCCRCRFAAAGSHVRRCRSRRYQPNLATLQEHGGVDHYVITTTVTNVGKESQTPDITQRVNRSVTVSCLRRNRYPH